MESSRRQWAALSRSMTHLALPSVESDRHRLPLLYAPWRYCPSLRPQQQHRLEKQDSQASRRGDGNDTATPLVAMALARRHTASTRPVAGSGRSIHSSPGQPRQLPQAASPSLPRQGSQGAAPFTPGAPASAAPQTQRMAHPGQGVARHVSGAALTPPSASRSAQRTMSAGASPRESAYGALSE